MILRPYVFAAAVAALMAQPIQTAHGQSTAHPREDIVNLDPAHSNIDFTLLGNLHKTDGRFNLKSGLIRVDPETGKVKILRCAVGVGSGCAELFRGSKRYRRTRWADCNRHQARASDFDSCSGRGGA